MIGCVAYMDSAWKLMELIGCSNYFNGEPRMICLFFSNVIATNWKCSVHINEKGKKIPVVGYISANSNL